MFRCGGEAYVSLRSLELCRRVPCASGRFNHARKVCRRCARRNNTLVAQVGGLGVGLATLPREKQYATETEVREFESANERIGSSGGPYGSQVCHFRHSGSWVSE